MGWTVLRKSTYYFYICFRVYMADFIELDLHVWMPSLYDHVTISFFKVISSPINIAKVDLQVLKEK